jgi:hypothetical protein
MSSSSDSRPIAADLTARLPDGSRRSLSGGLVNTLGLQVAEADARTLDLPVVAPVCGPSDYNRRRGTRASEHLVAGESHRPAIVAGNDRTFPDELFTQDL